MGSFHATVLADSVSPGGVRLTTFEVTFPRFILAEFNTHRVLSRNSASSRAVPIPKQVERIMTTPFVPDEWGSAQKGMVPGASVPRWKGFLADKVWEAARYPSVWAVQALDRLGVHKSYANRLLEPWMWHTVIVSATQWENFFALRRDAGAQREFRLATDLMWKALEASKPLFLVRGEEHLPLVYAEDKMVLPETDWSLLSAGRCARVSFDRHHDVEPRERSLGRARELGVSGHWSPFEHQAMVMDRHLAEQFNGNFHGDWAQFRKLFNNEHDFAALKQYGTNFKQKD